MFAAVERRAAAAHGAVDGGRGGRFGALEVAASDALRDVEGVAGAGAGEAGYTSCNLVGKLVGNLVGKVFSGKLLGKLVVW